MTLPNDASPVEPSAGLAAAAGRLFGDRLPLAIAYARLLATDGVERGLLGPREAPRLWERHLLNSAALGELLPDGTRLIDVGSGAGLPGIALAIARPDLDVTLLEPLERRVTFLDEAVAALGLTGVTVVRGRAEDVAGSIYAPFVTARAVAPLDRLAGWCLPLCETGGRLLAVKGSSAQTELAAHGAAVRRAGGGETRVIECGAGLLDPPTTVIDVTMLGRARGKSRR